MTAGCRCHDVRPVGQMPRMADDPFFSPNAKPPQPSVPRPAEPPWSVRKEDATWTAELRYHGEWGVEAQIFKQGELVIGRQFETWALAVQWAGEERRVLERGEA